MTTVPDLPPPGVQSDEDRRQISRIFIAHAREELAQGSRLQAGEKAWGAVVQPFKVIAEQRGWPHKSHEDIYDVVGQIALEYSLDSDQSRVVLDAYWIGPRNYYENYYSVADMAEVIDRVEELMPCLHQLATMPPGPFTITSNTQLRRLRRLTGDDNLQIGDASPVGFSKNH